MTTQSRPVRALRHLRHGEHLTESLPTNGSLIGSVNGSLNGSANGSTTEGSRAHDVVPTATITAPTPVGTPFGYLFDDLAAAFPAHHLPATDPDTVRADLKRLGEALFEQAPPQTDPLEVTSGNSTIPTVYTYWGQFIDHDITANTDRTSAISDVTTEHVVPILPATVVAELRNLRQPALNLDSLYGDGPSFDQTVPGPDAVPYDGPYFRLGVVATTNDDGTVPPGTHVVAHDEDHDLPRDLANPDVTQRSGALVGDGRNDENLIVAQLHLAMLKFHNAMVDYVRAHPTYPPEDDRGVFWRAQQMVRWHYQWLVVHDYLKTVTQAGVVDKVLLGGHPLLHLRDGETYMPLEFSIAAYRFGHSMVRGAYDYNANFGVGAGVIPFAPFNLIFAFTGSARPEAFRGDTTTLPFNWVIEWDRFVDKGSSNPAHFARRIDTQLAIPLNDMVNQVSPEDANLPAPIQAILKSLAVRNLLRGYQLSLPTGQAVASALGVPSLTAAELMQGNSDELNGALTDGGFLDTTPLWFYVLKEAEVQANGNSLGAVGSRIIAETIVGQVRNDPDSYLNQDGGWGPEFGARLPDGAPIVTIKDLFVFAGLEV